MAEHEDARLRENYNKLPRDVMYLAKGETELRRDLASTLGATEDMKDELQKELKRLRREHYNNLKDIENVMVKFDQQAHKVNGVSDRQHLNDSAMAAVFKIMKINF